MSEMLALEDLKEMSEAEVKEHIATGYGHGRGGGFDSDGISDADTVTARDTLAGFDVLVAYESVGDYGCDSSSWFLLRERGTGKLVEFSGSHCSCFGFEGQFDPEETTLDYLSSDKFYVGIGGYDEKGPENEAAIKNHIANLAVQAAV